MPSRPSVRMMGQVTTIMLSALEALATRKSIVTQSMLDARKKAWVEAYEHTPHGKPVTLE